MSDDRAEQAFRTAMATRAAAYEPVGRDVPEARRSRRWPAVLAAAVLVVAVVLAGAVLRSRDQQRPAPAGLPAGWRWESYRDIEVAVPGSWGYAAAPQSDWCASAPHRRTAPQPGYVDTREPGGGVLDILCAGTPPAALTAPHLTFPQSLDAEIPTPLGWTRESRTVGGIRIEVTMDAAHLPLAERILATAHVVTADQNGCAVSSPFEEPGSSRPDPAFAVESLRHVDSIAVCQYQLGVSGPGLVASLLLTGHAAEAELRALQSAQTGGGPSRPKNCDADRGPSGSTLLLTDGDRSHEMYAVYSGCLTNGIDDGTHVRELTKADCRPLFGPRVIDREGIEQAFRRCVPGVH
jgi:hypothetical protein